jgi:5'-nucleotidase
MNILLTNDDGITSEGITVLARVLRERTAHRILVVAPDSNRSGMSHSISVGVPLGLVPCGEDRWSCSGSPADCVIVGTMGGLPCGIDLVLSGINEGPNIGTDIIYSGTVAAARQAALHRIPALALSLAGLHEPWYWEAAAAWTVDNLEELTDSWAEDTVLNVNIPNIPGKPEKTVYTFPSVLRYSDELVSFTAPGDRRYFFIKFGKTQSDVEPLSDWEAFSRNWVSLSPVFIHPVVRRDMCAGVPEHGSAGPRPKGR